MQAQRCLLIFCHPLAMTEHGDLKNNMYEHSALVPHLITPTRDCFGINTTTTEDLETEKLYCPEGIFQVFMLLQWESVLFRKYAVWIYSTIP